MKKQILIFMLLLSSTAILKAQTHTKDEAAIRQTLQRFSTSWNKGDFSDMSDYMTADSHWINVVGMHWHNLKEVEYAHQVFIKTAFKNVERKELNVTIRFIAKDVAIAYWLTHVGVFYSPDGIDRGNNKQGDRDNLATVVLVKQNEKWLMSSVQNSDVVAQAAASDPVLRMNK